MKKYIIVFFLAVICLAPLSPAYAGKLEIRTYLKGPSQDFDRFHLPPQKTSAEGKCPAGTIYVAQKDDNLWFCKNGKWILFTSAWFQKEDILFPLATWTNPNVRLGIGTLEPSYTLHIKGVDNPDNQLFFDDNRLIFRAGGKL